MATTRRAANKAPAADWKSPGSPHELDEISSFAHGIVSDRRDLVPSVARIMDAGLEPDQRLRCLTMFRDSLSQPGDPNRDPRVAIERCLADHGAQGGA